MKRIIVTGFQPFDHDTINPAWEAVKRLPDRIYEKENESEGRETGSVYESGAESNRKFSGNECKYDQNVVCAELIKLEVPVVYGECFDAVSEAMDRYQPDAVICVGQAGGREGITPEIRAVNRMNARIPDNAGNQPIDVKIDENGPEKFTSTLPIREIVDALQSNGIGSYLSESAGEFVCNDLFYRVMKKAEENPGTIAGFVHVPFIPEQITGDRLKGKEIPSMPLDEIVRALQIIVEETIKINYHTEE